jgi:uncharacterized ion transporter superfamily protein YfcC
VRPAWRLRFPHPLTLLLAGVLVSAVLTHLLPAGRFERRADPATGRNVVVAGTYHAVEPAPVGPFQAVVAVPKGMADASSVIFFVFLIGGALTVVDRTGVLNTAVAALARRLEGREALAIPAVSLAFALGGALEGMAEEVIPLVPVLLVLSRRLGYDAVTTVAMSLGAAAVGGAFSPMNPFQVGIAQRVAEVPLLSGSIFRTIFLVAAVALWIAATMRYASRARVAQPVAEAATGGPMGARQAAVLALVAATFAVFVFGVVRLGWDFDQMAAVFLVMGVVAGIVGGLGLEGTATTMVEGFRGMALAALLIGVARAIYVVLEQGRIIDTIVHVLFTPIAGLPLFLSAMGMMASQTAVHVPLPSTTGQAVVTLPVLAPLCDLLGLSRQVMVLAYQYGGGLCELVTPTNGAMMAVLAASGVRYESWLRFAAPLTLGLLGLAAAALGAAMLVHL